MNESRAGTVGYDPLFLTIEVPLPRALPGRDIRELDYEHFTVVLDPERRLAAATAVNIDGATLREVARADNWRFDDRIPHDEQAGNDIYARNDLDRGHLVRRRDPVWGDEAEALRANDDTFFFTNAAPQAAGFNQSKETWNGVEDHVLDYALRWRHRVSVFTGPIFATDDPPYRGIRIPLRYFKVAAWAEGDELRSAAFVLDQSPSLDDVDLSALPAAPPLGPFRTFQVAVQDVANLTSLGMPELVAADVLAATPRATPDIPWRALASVDEAFLG